MEKCFAEGERACEEITRASQLTPETRDLISSLGERLCAPLVAAALGERGIESEAIDARDCLVTDARHGAANPALELTRQRCESRLRPLLKQGIVPVLTGFLGATPQGTLTTLGRGGSDYSASLMGAALDAHEVIIWTDVDGFLTSDPRLVPEACTIPQISYRQAAALAYFGARVLHPRTLQPVIQRGIPVWIRNTFAPEKEGTKITLDGAPHDSAVKALAVISDVSLIIMGVSGVEVAASVLHRAFAAVTAAHGDVLLTSHTHSPRELCFVVRSAVAKKTMDALRKEFTCEGYTPSACDILLRNGMALVTVVGQHLRELSGIARQAFEALEREELRVVASSQGASDCNISFVVARDEMQEIVDVLHKEFHLEKPGEAY